MSNTSISISMHTQTRRLTRSSSHPYKLQNQTELIFNYDHVDNNKTFKSFKLLVGRGHLVTFLNGEFIPWHSMGLTNSKGEVINTNPLSWSSIPGFKAPLCPHAENPFVSKDDSQMIIKFTQYRKTIRLQIQKANVTSSTNSAVGESGQPSANHATAEPKKPESLFDKATFKIRTQPESPQIHMAYNLKELPEIMWPHNAFKPQSLYGVIMKNLTFIDYQIGALIIKLNSSDGITILSFIEIMSAAQKCSGCCCVFSPEGYHAHLGYNKFPHMQPLCPSIAELEATTKISALTLDYARRHCEQNLCNEMSAVDVEACSLIGKLSAKQLQEHGRALLPPAIQAKANLVGNSDLDPDEELGKLVHPSDN
ncbi:hypothetical protein BT96DRAFT_1069991 [Gymnopus androsaceus JB14]|uniref:Uncharacterized protein n=1 Tax=Gymnopus androsaceus JB14 TaxID=1447944 RepID=A0A6A4GUM4_9AGAR|nr:hypothetical protein BT96DRAFT_1069991 [Gymnopus androsaceus JB14]